MEKIKHSVGCSWDKAEVKTPESQSSSFPSHVRDKEEIEKAMDAWIDWILQQKD